jgi:DNA polymerase I-like protein with 3'-5' exonuclease and polymerase domains
MGEKMINIQTREQFDEALEYLAKAKFVVADTETNGLGYYRGDYIISISVYLPDFDKAYNFPFKHGEGIVRPRYTGKNTASTNFADMTWQGNAKKDIYLGYMFAKFKESVDSEYFGNLPVEWMDELKAVWGLEGVTYLFHNARFDLHMLRDSGFPTPDKTLDTMLALHLVHEDWRGIQVEAPYKENNKWVMLENGTPLKKKQYGNRKLKWQSMFWGLENAHIGENELEGAKIEFERTLANYICDTALQDRMNDSLRYKKQVDQNSVKQLGRITSKLNISSKAHMWMLPSQDVWEYAVMDTILTYKLYQKLLPILESWDNVGLFFNACAIQQHVAWVMECNGMQIDEEQAKVQIATLEPRIQEIDDVFSTWGLNLSLEGLSEQYAKEVRASGGGASVNFASPEQLLPYLNDMLTTSVDLSLIPDWFDKKKIAECDNAPMEVRLKSTAKEALEPYAAHPVVMLLMEYRKLNKTVTTYLKKWLSAVDANGIVHGSMNPDGTVAGRFSSSGASGNMQNVPDRGGYRVKTAVVPYSDEWILFAIDYGQLEARVSAWIAEILLPEQGAYSIEQPTMVNLFNEGADMHSYVRDMVGVREILFGDDPDEAIALRVGVDPSAMSSEELHEYIEHKVCRQTAKTLNFGLIYSGTHHMLSKLLKIETTPAKELERRWRTLFPAFAKAQTHYEELGQTWRGIPNGEGRGMYVTQPITGRHRKAHKYSTWMWFYENGVRKGFNPRQASARKFWNNVVQGLSGWMSVHSALLYQGAWGWDNMKLFAQIHDALDGYAHKTELWRVQKLMEYMVDFPTNPALTVDLEAGYNWQPASKDNPQGLRTVKDMHAWMVSGGVTGYES